MLIQNKSAQSGMNVVFWIIGILVVGYALNIPAGFQDTVNGWFGSSSSPTSSTSDGQNLYLKDCPSDGTSTLTLNVQDELASVPTNLDTEYYVYNGNKLIKSGATGSDGTVDIDVACGKDYKFLLVNTTAGTGGGLYAKTIDVPARISEDTLNVQLVRVGTAQILGIFNTIRNTDTNSSAVPGGTTNFDLKFTINMSNRGYDHPTVFCQVNSTLVSDINLKFTDGTEAKEVTAIPRRLSPLVNYKFYGFEYPKMLQSGDGVKIASGSFTSLGSAGLGNLRDSDMRCIVVDTATWRHPDYTVAKSIAEGFPSGTENVETIADIGGPDAPSSTFGFNNTAGY